MKGRHIKADDEQWFVKLSEFPPHPGVDAIVFLPRNAQRPYRVVEVPQGRYRSQDELEKLSDGDLLKLWKGGDLMDYAHDARAGLNHPAHFARPLPPDVGTGES